MSGPKRGIVRARIANWLTRRIIDYSMQRERWLADLSGQKPENIDALRVGIAALTRAIDDFTVHHTFLMNEFPSPAGSPAEGLPVTAAPSVEAHNTTLDGRPASLSPIAGQCVAKEAEPLC